MSEPLISVILPIYNIQNYLKKCMDSIFAQTYKNLEIIMVDDGSTDESSDMCDKYIAEDSRVVVFHKKNGGLSDARNYGIKRAKGEYITCIDPDDFVDMDYVEYLYKLLTENGTRMSVCQHRVLYDGRKNDELGSSGSEVLTNKVCIERMLYHDVIDTSAWAKLYEKSLFDTVEYPKGKLFEDIGTTYKLMLQCEKIAVGYESKYNYIVRESSIVNCSFSKKKLDLLETTDDMAKNVLKVYPDLDKAVMRRRTYARFSTLNQMSKTRDFKTERNEMIRFIKENKSVLMSDPKVPKRDILALRMLSMGYFMYKISWNTYVKIKK